MELAQEHDICLVEKTNSNKRIELSLYSKSNGDRAGGFFSLPTVSGYEVRNPPFSMVRRSLHARMHARILPFIRSY